MYKEDMYIWLRFYNNPTADEWSAVSFPVFCIEQMSIELKQHIEYIRCIRLREAYTINLHNIKKNIHDYRYKLFMFAIIELKNPANKITEN